MPLKNKKNSFILVSRGLKLNFFSFLKSQDTPISIERFRRLVNKYNIRYTLNFKYDFLCCPKVLFRNEISKYFSFQIWTHFPIALCEALCLKEVHIPLNGYNHSALLMTVGFLYFIVRQNIYNRSWSLQRISEYRLCFQYFARLLIRVFNIWSARYHIRFESRFYGYSVVYCYFVFKPFILQKESL